MGVPHRDLSPVLGWFRKRMLLRDFKSALRWRDQLAPRSAPPPNLPYGPSHKLSANYYFTRDGRHEVKPPVVIAQSGAKLISAGDGKTSLKDALSPENFGRILPGKGYTWKEVPVKAP